ncbi:MAG: hypothetical protein ACD_75C00924G0001, partial [uncultured bacterium]
MHAYFVVPRAGAWIETIRLR